MNTNSSPHRRLRMALIGCGMRGRCHHDAIDAVAGMDLAAICDADAQRLANASAGQKDLHAFADWGDMLGQVDLDAAVVALPHHLHAPAAIDCMAAGLDVLVENPIATTLQEADRMAEAARRHGRVLMVGNSYRYTPPCMTVHQLIDSGRIGSPAMVYGAWLGPRWMMAGGTWATRADQAGGGPLMGYGVHLFDLLEWLIGPVASVYAAVSSEIVQGIDVEDSVSLLVRFEQGTHGNFAISWADHTDRFRLDMEILGTRGRVAFSPRGMLRLADGSSTDLVDLPAVATDAHALHHEFAGAIAQRREPLTGAATATRALACTLAAYRSAREGRPVAVEGAAT
jgi:phthalate 4,5-cis-dihydrodiol dehydrogenase